MNPLLAMTLVLFVLLPIGDMIATWFFFYLYRQSKRTPAPTPGAPSQANRPRLWGGPVFFFAGRSWLLGMMSAAWAVITIVYVLIGWLAVRRLLGQPSLPEGAWLITVGLIALGLIPIAFAIAFYKTRRRGGRGGPPPFSETD